MAPKQVRVTLEVVIPLDTIVSEEELVDDFGGDIRECISWFAGEGEPLWDLDDLEVVDVVVE